MSAKQTIESLIKLAENEKASVHKQLNEKGAILAHMCENPDGAYPHGFATFGGEIAFLGAKAEELRVKIGQFNQILDCLNENQNDDEAYTESWAIIERAGDALEDANHHSIADFPSKFWHEIYHLIPDEHKIKVANAIANNIL